jgi:hypothetical protein
MDRYLGQHPQPVRAAVDDETAAYILETRRGFEDLREVAVQLAGLLVLVASGSQSAGPHHPILSSAAQLYQNTLETVHHARVPPSAREHHQGLLHAAAALGNAIAAAQSGLAIDPVLIPLRAAYGHLQRASNALPGFPMVAFDVGCCGAGSVWLRINL